MSYYQIDGNKVNVMDRHSAIVSTELPPATYIVKYMEPFDRYYLERVEDMKIPTKIYGDTHANAQKIMTTFLDRATLGISTGVMLSGEKGAGKTLLAKVLSSMARGTKMPTIIINAPYHGDTFNKFIQDIDTPSLVFFDEFEKTYQDYRDQNGILTLFDGVAQSKKLFVVACNDTHRLSDYFHNRPGRLYYHIQYETLSVEFVKEYCEDRLHNKDHIQQIVNVSSIFDAFNFDMLQTLVEEMNRYKQTAKEAVQMLNCKVSGTSVFYAVSVKKNGKPQDSGTPRFRGSPATHQEIILEYGELEKYVLGEDEHTIALQQKDMVKFDAFKGIYLYRTGDIEVEFVREEKSTFSALDYAY